MKVYFCALFVLVSTLVFVFNRKLEHLTIEEVDEKATKATEKVNTLEDEYKALQVKLDSQDAKMAAASSQATAAQALLDTSTMD
jgi:hypothetical protein